MYFMSKDPAFLFYTGDFITGTQFFSDEQVGKYVRLLAAQHQLGRLHEKHMLQICKTHDEDVFGKFIKDENGLYYNQRLENEIVKRKAYSKSRAENRKKNKNISLSYDLHMENENKDKDINNNTLHNKVKLEVEKNKNSQNGNEQEIESGVFCGDTYLSKEAIERITAEIAKISS